MPTENQDKPGEHDQRANIEGWLLKQGYPLEMRVASAMRQAGFTVFQSDYFRDPEDQVTQREIDVVAWVTRRNSEGSGFSRIVYPVECKHQSKPWVFFGGEMVGLAPAASVAQRVTNPMAEARLIELAHQVDVQQERLFALAEHQAYGLTVAMENQKDDAYAAAMTATKAAVSIASDYDRGRSGIFMFVVAMPIVVTDAPLWFCSLGADGKPSLEESVTIADVLWRHGISGQPHSILRVVGVSALEAWASRAFVDASGFLDRRDWTV